MAKAPKKPQKPKRSSPGKRARPEPKHRYNWRPDLPDQRDMSFSLAPPKAPSRTLPGKVDLRPTCSPVFDQGKIGSCTGNALAGALEFLELSELKAGGSEVFTKGKFLHFSRLFIYFNERDLEGTPDQDSGAQLRDGIKTLNHFGACRESLWKYSPSLVFSKPSAQAYADAKGHAITSYLRLQTLAEMKQCLADGFPFVFGFTVYESFETPDVARTGVMPLPAAGERVLGGHAVMAVGYDDSSKRLIVRNSWGPKWGESGYFTMPYAYIEKKLAQDFWTVRN